MEFLNLIESVASEMSSVLEINAWRYRDILCNILTMYCDMVSLQHCKTLEFKPQQPAGMYTIAHFNFSKLFVIL